MLENEAILKSILTTAPIAIGMVRNRIFYWVNEQMTRLVGYRAEELIGRNAKILYENEAEFERVGREKYKPIETGGLGEVETRWICKNGTIIDVHLRSSCLNPADLTAVLFMALDITTRKEAERALRRECDKAQRYLDIAGVMILVLDSKGNITLINKKGCEILAYREDELIGRNWFSHFLSSARREKMQAIFKELIAGRIDVAEYHENPIITKTGEERFIAWHNTILTDENDKIIGTLSSGEDITERKQTEETLRSTEELFRQLVDNVREVLWITSLDWLTIFYVSPAYETLWGRPCRELYTDPRSWLNAVDDRDRFGLELEIEKKSKGDFSNVELPEYRIIRPDGSARWILSRFFPVQDEEGKVYRIAGIAEDITERKQFEDEFRHAQKMEAIGRLAGGIAHDFNNLLTAILGYGEIALMQLGDHPVKEKIKVMYEAGKRASVLTRQLLAFSRRQIMEIRLVDPNVIIKEIGAMLRRLIGEDIELSLQTEAPIPNIMADPGQIEQVLMNLAVNARDAMPHGGKLTISAHECYLDETYIRGAEEVRPGRYVRVRVEDTGEGMSREVMDKIFEPFFTTKAAGKGTGLGLATAYGIVKQHNGHIQVTSEPGKGTVFEIYFPAVLAALTPSIDKTATMLPRGTETILVVDDEEGIRRLLRDCLSSLGYHPIEAASGEEALKLASAESVAVNLLITDVIMPKMNGWELAKNLQKINPHLKVIYISGYSPDIISPHLRQGQKINFLKKPLMPSTLAAKVRETLDLSEE